MQLRKESLKKSGLQYKPPAQRSFNPLSPNSEGIEISHLHHYFLFKQSSDENEVIGEVKMS